MRRNCLGNPYVDGKILLKMDLIVIQNPVQLGSGANTA